MSPVHRTLLVILAFLIVSVGSFIWYIATWDPAERSSVTHRPTTFHLWQNTPGSGAEPRSALIPTRSA
jgi:hypothetical protein